MKKTLIIGNGFDLALNIKTSYRDFMESDEYDDNSCNFPYLSDYFHDNCESNPLWSGIEDDLLNYINEEIEDSYKSDIERFPDDKKSLLVDKIKAIDSFKQELECLKMTLQRYLLNLKQHGRENPDKVKSKINEIIYGGSDTSVYSFNFTNFYQHFYQHPQIKFFHLHDCLNEKNDCNIIFGVQSDDLDSRQYNFILKSVAHNYKYYKDDKDIIQNRIKESDEIYFYGYSFGDSDSTMISNIFVIENFKPNAKIELIAESTQSINKMKANIRHIIGSKSFDKYFAHRINGVVI